MNSTPSCAAPPGRAARLALASIRVYKLVLSPWFTGACRFVPTCADYTAEAIARHGFLRGSWLGARRLSRCHPFGGHGHDPVPFPPAPGDPESTRGVPPHFTSHPRSH